MDPCDREERVMDGLLMIAMNKHREICSIQSSGGIMLLKEQVNISLLLHYIVRAEMYHHDGNWRGKLLLNSVFVSAVEGHEMQ